MTHITTTAATNLLQVFSTPQESKPGHLLIVARQRNSKEKTVTEAQRMRCIHVPEAQLLAPAESMPGKFLSIVNAKLAELASDRLSHQWLNEGDPVQVDPAIYTIDNLLTFYADKVRASTIDGDAILAWLNRSATLATIPEGKRTAWTTKLPKMAGPGFRGVVNADAAAKILAQISEADHQEPACIFIMKRLATIIEEASADAF